MNCSRSWKKQVIMHPRRRNPLPNQPAICFFIFLTTTAFFLFLLFIRTTTKHHQLPSWSPPSNSSSGVPKTFHQLSVLVFFSSRQPEFDDSIFDHLPRHSLTIVCGQQACPQVKNSGVYRTIESLDDYEPPMTSDMILVLDAESMPTLDMTWLSNAARIALAVSPRIAAVAGIDSITFACASRNGPAPIALPPFAIPTRHWPITNTLAKSSSNSLHLSWILANSLNWSSVVVPLQNSISHPTVSEICQFYLPKLIKLSADSNTQWSAQPLLQLQLEPQVGILVTKNHLKISNWLALLGKLIEKFNAHIYFLQESHANLQEDDDSDIIATIQRWTRRQDIPIHVVSPAPYSTFHQTVHNLILENHSLQVIFHLFGDDLPHRFMKSSNSPENLAENENDPAAEEECVLIGLPVQEILAADWILGLELRTLKNWHKPQIDISVITNDRSESLNRLLNSLTGAIYYGDRVNIVINMEQTSDQKTRKLVERLEWKYGTKTVRQRIIQGGLLPAVIESWYPSNHHHSYGVLLEDDVEVSSHFYGWLKFSLLNYRYSGGTFPQIYGISLYQPQHNELRPEGRRPFNAPDMLTKLGKSPATMPYASQVPCSWGALFFPEHWMQFHRYLTFRLADKLIDVQLGDPIISLPIRSTRWSKSWKKYLIEFVFLKGSVMLYPNYHRLDGDDGDGDRVPTGLSTNHLEFGTHVHDHSSSTSIHKKFQWTKWEDSPSKNSHDQQQQLEKILKLKKEFEINLKPLNSSLLDGLSSSSPFPSFKQQGGEEMEDIKLPKVETEMVFLDLWSFPSSLIDLKYRGFFQALQLGLCDPLHHLHLQDKVSLEYRALLDSICLI